MHIRRLSYIAVALASAVSLLGLTQQTATATEAPGAPTAVKGVPWSAQHGAATASGTRWTEKGSGIFPDLKIKGEFKNMGKECYSVWVQWNLDLVPGPPFKHATLCGPGAKSIDYAWPNCSFTTTGDLFVCKGDKDTKNCGTRESMTSWPIKQAR